MVNIIVAVGNYVVNKGYPIGKDGGIPWHNSLDMKWFKETTTGHPVIMGRKTFETIGKPLPNRTNIVITKNNDLWPDNAGIRVCDTVEKAIDFAKAIDNEIFIIGGESIYRYVLENNLVDKILVDFLAEEVDNATSFFPDVFSSNDWFENSRPLEIESRKAYAMEYVRAMGQNNHVDEQYLKLVNDTIEHGAEKDTRAGKTRSVFGRQLRFNLKEGLPMLTTKKMFSKGVIHELLWFLKGDTNIKYLVDNGVHIWDDDAYRYFLQTICKKPGAGNEMDKEEFLKHVLIGDEWYFFADKSYRFGDLGPVYGHQWRNWNGVDQVKEVVEKLRNNPDDRRIMISAWNVGEIKDMALPPCHYSCQFYTKKIENGKRELSCMWNQRSVDEILGLPFNILSYSILTYLIAQCCEMEVGELIFNGGDCHVYQNQIEIYEKEQKNRNPHLYALPKLELNPNIKNIDDFTYDDIKIIGYNSYQTVKYPLSVGL